MNKNGWNCSNKKRNKQSKHSGRHRRIHRSQSINLRPLITIASHTIVIQGKITESLVGKLAIDQAVTIHLPNRSKGLGGIVSDIGSFPINEPSFRQRSEYPFTVHLVEQAQHANKPQPTIPFGYHVDITIVTKRKNGAITVPAKAVWHENNRAYIYVIRNGQLENGASP
ncbi:hypothetical protein F6Y03_00110 [Bacillus megaterium]|nr:hypothetical protein [Priestia megaterium]